MSASAAGLAATVAAAAWFAVAFSILAITGFVRHFYSFSKRHSIYAIQKIHHEFDE
jgi:hypothetical protein